MWALTHVSRRERETETKRKKRQKLSESVREKWQWERDRTHREGVGEKGEGKPELSLEGLFPSPLALSLLSVGFSFLSFFSFFNCYCFYLCFQECIILPTSPPCCQALPMKPSTLFFPLKNFSLTFHSQDWHWHVLLFDEKWTQMTKRWAKREYEEEVGSLMTSLTLMTVAPFRDDNEYTEHVWHINIGKHLAETGSTHTHSVTL